MGKNLECIQKRLVPRKHQLQQKLLEQTAEAAKPKERRIRWRKKKEIVLKMYSANLKGI